MKPSRKNDTSRSRRAFLKISTALSGSLAGTFTLGFLPSIVSVAQAASPSPSASVPTWVSINENGRIRLIVAKSEMGQGVLTTWAMVAAEELHVDLARIEIESAPVAPMFRDPTLKKQATFGSTGISAFYDTLAGTCAAMRESLILAGAQRLHVGPLECRAQNGRIVHSPSGRSIGFGEVAGDAAKLPRPDIGAKRPEAASLLGKPIAQVGGRAKCNGQAKYGLDVTLPGMLTAVLVRPPTIGATLASFDKASVMSRPGVRDAIATSAGVAVVADGFWNAKMAKEAFEVAWHRPLTFHPDSEALARHYRERAEGDGVLVVKIGKPVETIAASEKIISVEYDAPFLAHAPMEPLNCTAFMAQDQLHVWVGTQDQDLTLETAMKVSGLPADKIHIHSQLMGGGFGRRAAVDFVRPAIEIAMRMKHPVKLVFERADDIRGGYYRPAAFARFEAGLDAKGKITAYRAKIVSSSVSINFFGEHAKNAHGEYDFFAVQGLVTLPYPVAHRESRWIRDESGIPAWIWRGVGLSQNIFFLESFIDELAFAAGQDPLQFRIAHLAPESRACKVLQLAARQSHWDMPPPPGRARGLALHAHANVFMALVAEVSIDNVGKPKVHHVTFVLDCGRVLNPSAVRAQMEGGVMMGLSAAQSEGITFTDGAVSQSNFHDYPVLRLSEAPSVDAHIIEGSNAVVGMGEFTNTTIAPAVANAMFRLSGKRVRKFPLIAR